MSEKYDRELYQLYKTYGVCVQCGRRDAAPGRVRCEICLAKNAESTKRHIDSLTPEQREEKRRNDNINNKARREQRKAEGKCIWCGKPLDPNSECFCIDCRIKNQRRNDKRKKGVARIERSSYGYCYRCGKPIESGTLCEACKQTSIDNLPDKMCDSLYRINRQQNNLIFRNSL